MRILFVDCCISQRGKNSRTALLCKAFLDAYHQNHPTAEHVLLDVAALQLSPFNVPMLNSRDQLVREGCFESSMFALARQFREADAILVGAPFWDLSFPAQLLLYIEQISVSGFTYYFDAQGPHGSCKAKWLVYLTSGGSYEPAESIGALHWKQLCGLFGIGQFFSVFAGGLDAAPQTATQSLEKACDEARALALRL